MSDRKALEDALLRIEKAARAALHLAIDTDEGQELADALRSLDLKRSAIRAARGWSERADAADAAKAAHRG